MKSLIRVILPTLIGLVAMLVFFGSAFLLVALLWHYPIITTITFTIIVSHLVGIAILTYREDFRRMTEK